jgi:hypothetical protein
LLKDQTPHTFGSFSTYMDGAALNLIGEDVLA